MPRRWLAMIAAGAIAASALAACSRPAQKAPETKRQEVLELLQARKTQEAFDIATKTAQSHPKDAEARFLVGLSLYARGSVDAAIQEYLKAVELDKTHLMAMNNLGNAYRDKDNEAEAEKWYRKAMDTNPQFAVPVQQLAIMFERKGKMEPAIKVLEEGTQKMTGNADLLVQLGLLYEETEKPEKAKEAYTKALAISANHQQAKERLAAVSGKK